MSALMPQSVPERGGGDSDAPSAGGSGLARDSPCPGAGGRDAEPPAHEPSQVALVGEAAALGDLGNRIVRRGQKAAGALDPERANALPDALVPVAPVGPRQMDGV